MMFSEDYSRRQVLKAGSAVVGCVGISSYGVDASNELSVEIAVDHELAEKSVEETSNDQYVHELLHHYVERFYSPIFSEIDIKYAEETPEVGDDFNETLEHWSDISTSGYHSFLFTSEYYDVGEPRGEIRNEVPRGSSSLVGQGFDLLNLNKGAWENRLVVDRYEEGDIRGSFPPFATVLALLHEIGHAEGLDHEDGEITETENGFEATLMAAPDFDNRERYEDLMEEGDELVIKSELSDRSENQLRNFPV